MRSYSVRKSFEGILDPNNSCLANIKIDSDPEVFIKFIRKNLLPDWELVNDIYLSHIPYMVNPSIRHLLPRTVITIAKHYDKREGDALVDAFQVFIWIANRGIGVTDIFETELRHSVRPDREILDVNFSPEITDLTDNYLNMELRAYNSVWDWRFHEDLLFLWGK